MSVYSLTISNGGSQADPVQFTDVGQNKWWKSLIATGFTMKSLAEPVYVIEKLEQPSRN